MHVPGMLPSKTVLKVFIEKDPVLLVTADLFFINVPAFGYCQPFWVKKAETSTYLLCAADRNFRAAILVRIGLCTLGRIQHIKRFWKWRENLLVPFRSLNDLKGQKNEASLGSPQKVGMQFSVCS